MTVDLDHLSSLHAMTTPGEWEHREHDGLHAIAGGYGWAVEGNDGIPAGDDFRSVVALHNAWPEAEAELRALREVAKAAISYVDCPPLNQERDARNDSLRAALAKVPT